MVLDTLKNASLYNSLNPRFAKVFKYLESVDFLGITEGKYAIDGDDVFLLVNENKELKKPENAALEVHDKYIDIQIVVKGKEGFGWKDRTLCTAPRGEMDTTKDILFFDDKPSTYFTLQAGEMAILFPGDAHAPLVGEGTVRKFIIKVKA